MRGQIDHGVILVENTLLASGRGIVIRCPCSIAIDNGYIVISGLEGLVKCTVTSGLYVIEREDF